MTTKAKSGAVGSFHVRLTTPSPAVATSEPTSSGGCRSGGGGSGGGVVPGGGCGRTVMLAVAETLFPLASRATNVTVVVPTGSTDGALFVTVGCGSTRSEALALASQAATSESEEEAPAGDDA